LLAGRRGCGGEGCGVGGGGGGGGCRVALAKCGFRGPCQSNAGRVRA